jgi:phage terminase large subunit-like protein
MAANQVGKTLAASFETSFHLTGLYPEWWDGRRFGTPTKIWAGGPNSEHVRDNAQRLLFGDNGEWGTGAIPGHSITKIEKKSGIAEAIDFARIKHVSGGESYIKFKSYDQDVDAWSGETLHAVWYDEEPDYARYTEGLTRTNTGDNGRPGMVYLTLTPLLGMTKVARLFHPRPREMDAHMVRMGLQDALHYTEQDRIAIAASYPDHERKARVQGFPQLGEGAVFQVDYEQVVVSHPEELRWWVFLGGIDFGFDHPCGGVRIGWDREGDVIYVLQEYRQSRALTPMIASTLRRWDPEMAWAWPHDGYVHDRQSGKHTKTLFEEEGLFMLPIHAQYEEGQPGLEASVQEINDRMNSGRLKISRNCPMLREEMESYRREKGKIVKEYDDLISALRYAVMMKRFASFKDMESKKPAVLRGVDYNPFNG